MIPKVIHYCWFGYGEKTDLMIRYIDSWKKFLPDYEIIEWNESNYDVNKIQYTKEAYAAKKYAFVSDFARFDILYAQGGLYFDTDVEVIKPIDDIVSRGSFMGCETAPYINAGLGFGCEPGMEIFDEIIRSYGPLKFLNGDGSYNTKTVVAYVTEIFALHGFRSGASLQTIKGVSIYPPEYFCPKNYETGKLRITANTCTIHHFNASWMQKNLAYYLKKRVVAMMVFFLGRGRTERLLKFLKARR